MVRGDIMQLEAHTPALTDDFMRDIEFYSQDNSTALDDHIIAETLNNDYASLALAGA